MIRNPVEVWDDWEKCKLNPSFSHDLSDAVAKILANWERYEQVGKMFGIPTWVIGALHCRESDFNFTTYLANGDPILWRGVPVATIHTPAGIGPVPNWQEGAMLSIKNKKWHAGMDWDLVSALTHCESWNGWGYANHSVRSPYIWSGTNLYTGGKFSSDGHYDATLVDKQLGCAALAMGLKIHGLDLNEKKYV